mgnify:CR=1
CDAMLVPALSGARDLFGVQTRVLTDMAKLTLGDRSWTVFFYVSPLGLAIVDIFLVVFWQWIKLPKACIFLCPGGLLHRKALLRFL